MDVYSGALYIVARLTRHSRGKTWLQNRILDTAALTALAHDCPARWVDGVPYYQYQISQSSPQVDS